MSKRDIIRDMFCCLNLAQNILEKLKKKNHRIEIPYLLRQLTLKEILELRRF